MTSVMPGQRDRPTIGQVRWALISALRGADKVQAVRTVIAAIRAHGVRVAGFFQEPAAVGDDHAIVRIRTGERTGLGRRGTLPRSATEQVFCSFSFDRLAFERAHGWLRADAAEADVLVLDEIGKLEASGQGHARSLTHALAGGALVILATRAHQLPSVVERFQLGEAIAALEPPFHPTSIEGFCDDVVRAVEER
jgi:nucleoside-triphosphatase THEP1